MIRKMFTLALLGISLVTANAFTLSITIPPNSMTNLFPLTQGSAYVYQAIITSTSTTNGVTVQLVDTPTNTLAYINAAYTNRYSYATNLIVTTTNFYGVATSTTNIALWDITNNVVPITTNNYPVRASLASSIGGSAAFPQLNSYFSTGIWATNLSTNSAILTISARNGE